MLGLTAIFNPIRPVLPHGPYCENRHVGLHGDARPGIGWHDDPCNSSRDSAMPSRKSRSISSSSYYGLQSLEDLPCLVPFAGVHQHLCGLNRRNSEGIRRIRRNRRPSVKNKKTAITRMVITASLTGGPTGNTTLPKAM